MAGDHFTQRFHVRDLDRLNVRHTVRAAYVVVFATAEAVVWHKLID